MEFFCIYNLMSFLIKSEVFEYFLVGIWVCDICDSKY